MRRVLSFCFCFSAIFAYLFFATSQLRRRELQEWSKKLINQAWKCCNVVCSRICAVQNKGIILNLFAHRGRTSYVIIMWNWSDILKVWSDSVWWLIVVSNTVQALACRTGRLAWPARYTSARTKILDMDGGVRSTRTSAKHKARNLASRLARTLVYSAGPANPPVLQAMQVCDNPAKMYLQH